MNGRKKAQEEQKGGEELVGMTDVEVTGSEQRIFQLCDIVREASFDLHKYLRHGHMEKVYENGLAIRLLKRGLEVKQQHPLAVRDQDGTELGHYAVDLLVEKVLIVEIKATSSIAQEHFAQILGYLRACGMEHGLLIKFGAPRLYIKKLYLSSL